MHSIKIRFLYSCLFLFVLSSCGSGSANITRAYLSWRYVLFRAGDLHGLPPTSDEVLDRNPGYTSYIDLFNKDKSYISFQCFGTSYEDFYCECSFKLVDVNDVTIIENNNFKCEYSGGQLGKIIYNDDDAKKALGTIYVYTPYWCRWQFEYDINNNGDKTLLTFEFWKNVPNPLPEFLNNNN